MPSKHHIITKSGMNKYSILHAASDPLHTPRPAHRAKTTYSNVKERIEERVERHQQQAQQKAEQAAAAASASARSATAQTAEELAAAVAAAEASRASLAASSTGRVGCNYQPELN